MEGRSLELGAGSRSQGASDAALRQIISREHSARTSGRRNFTAGGRERKRIGLGKPGAWIGNPSLEIEAGS
jgi:hypothetical protein